MGHMRTMEWYRDPHLELDFERGSACLDGNGMTFTRKEYQLLAMLAQNAGEIIRRDVLLLRVWGYSREIRTRTLDVHIRRLRKKLGAYGDRYIETIFGVGYRFQPYREYAPFQTFAPTLPVAVGF